MIRFILSIALVAALSGICLAEDNEIQEKQMKEPLKEEKENQQNPLVLMQTNYGDIVIEVYLEKMPIHAGNFLKLVDEGFYDSLTFHRVVPNFVIQGGDPEGTGMGGPPGQLEEEESPYKHDRQTIAMARSPEGASKSQFYINLKNNYRLDEMSFAVFARVVEGMDVVDEISRVKTTGLRRETPVTPVIMTHVSRKE